MNVQLSDQQLAHMRVMASAGSGKTYRLTNRVLQLLLAGAEPHSILATTFTVKAAGEIRQRIFERLLVAAQDDASCAELAQALELDGLTTDRVHALIDELAEDLHRLQIRTIDGFFALIVRCFALELGVSGNATPIEPGQETILHQEVMHRLLDRSDVEDFVELLRRYTMGDASRSVRQIILDAVKAFTDYVADARPNAFDFLPESTGILEPDELNAAIEALAAWECQTNAIQKGHRKVLESVHSRNWQAFLGEKFIEKITSGDMKYSRSEIPSECAELYDPVIAHAAATVRTRFRERTLACKTLIEQFVDLYAELKRERGVITFSDLTAVLRNAEMLGSLDEIYYRIDGRINHLLLDEFQDTNNAQWSIFKPIIEELVSQRPVDVSFFCVGDVKQSIYGWRHATPWILRSLDKLLAGHTGESMIRTESMSTSYRSAKEIMTFTNQVFDDLPNRDAMRGRTPVATDWIGGFEDHTTARTALKGCVRVRVAPEAEKVAGEENSKPSHELAVERAEAWHNAVPGASIAVLARTNATVMNTLVALQERGVPASAFGGGPLTDVAPNVIMLDALRLADHPADTAAAFNVASSPLGMHLRIPPEGWKSSSTRVRAARTIRRTLIEDGYAMTLARWVACLAECSTQREQQRMHQLLALADKYEPMATMRPCDFLSFVAATNVAQPGFAPVQVMTVHQAKGLEFDLVILPELDKEFSRAGQQKVLWDRNTPSGPIERICPYANKVIQSLFEESLPDMLEATVAEEVTDSLSNLYVAVTRAIHGLELIIPAPAMSKNGGRTGGSISASTPARLIEQAVTDDPESTLADSILYECGDEAAVLKQLAEKYDDAARCAPPDASPEFVLSDLSSSKVLRSAAAASSHDEGLSAVLTLSHRDALDRGTAIHALFESIEWLDSGPGPVEFGIDAAAETLLRQVLPRRDQAWRAEILGEFQSICTRPDVVLQLTRPACPDGGRVEVWPEHPFARVTSDGLQRGFIDRVHVTYDASETICDVAILDFKTDRIPEGTDIDAYGQEKYGRQLGVYREVMAELTGLPAERIRTGLVFV